MSSDTLILSDATFDEAMAEADGSTVVVDFWAPWCAPCKAVSAILEEVAQELRGRVMVGKLNVAENPVVPERFSVTGIPTLIIFRDGEARHHLVGVVDKTTLISELRPYLGDADVFDVG